MKSAEEIMEILEAFDLVGTLRGAAELAGCDHKTVARYVEARERAGGGLPQERRARPCVDPFVEKIAEWVARSRGRIRADRAHERLLAMGYQGSERTTRRALAEAKRAERSAFAAARKAVFVTPPGRRNRLWQLDWTEFETLAQLDDYRDFYNRVRPHETLAQTLPITRYLRPARQQRDRGGKP